MRTYKFRIYPSRKQIEALETTMNLCREFYNAMLQQRVYAYRNGKKVNYVSQQNEIPELKKSFSEFNNIHSQVLQDVARRLDNAFQNFFRRVKERGKNIKAGYPRFKSINRYNSLTYPQSGFKLLQNGHVWLSKIGEVRMFMHRSVNGKIKTLSIKRDTCDDWFITIVTDEARIQDHLQEPICVENPVGIDLGIKSLATTSDGIYIDPPQFMRKSERKIQRLQKNLSRKKKGSGKREKAKKSLAKAHRKIERQRSDFVHTVSSHLVSHHDFIAFEDLNIQGMVKIHNLAKSISDAGWDKLVKYTTYKAESAGGIVVAS